jgi:hypothetical protein
MNNLKFIITIGSTNTTLIHSPIGWEDACIKYSRSDKYFGLFKSVSTKLEFVKEGATLLRDCFYNGGIEASALLKIYRLNKILLNYTLYYTGLIDFSTIKDELKKVSVNIVQYGEWESIKSRSNNDFEIDIDSHPNVKTIGAEFQPLNQFRKFQGLQSLDTGTYYVGDHFLGLFESESNILLNDSHSQTVERSAYTPGSFPAEKRFFWFDPLNADHIDFVINLKGTLQCASAGNVDFVLHGFSGLGYSIANIIGVTPSLISVDVSITISFTTASLPSADWYIYAQTNTGSFSYSDFHETTVQVNYYGYPDKKNIKALSVLDVFEKLITECNAGVLPSYQSTFLNTYNEYLLTSGDAIRGLTGSKLKLSLDTFFKNMDKIFNIGMGYDVISGVDKLVLEEKAYFLPDTLNVNIGNAGDISVEPYKDVFLNTLKVGYKEQKYDNVLNGKYEFNLEQSWNLPIIKLVKEGEYRCDFRADIYGILFTALNLEGKTTTDSSSDNSIFIFQTTVTGATAVLERDYDVSSVLNFIDPDYLWNYKLTPKRNLLRYGNILHSICDHLEADYITFGTATQLNNLQVKANDEAAAVVENVNILVSDLANKLHLPYFLNVELIIPETLDENMILNKNGYVTFDFKNESYKGYFWDVEINLQQKKTFTCKLLSHPSNDLTKLIR